MSWYVRELLGREKDTSSTQKASGGNSEPGHPPQYHTAAAAALRAYLLPGQTILKGHLHQNYDTKRGRQVDYKRVQKNWLWLWQPLPSRI